MIVIDSTVEGGKKGFTLIELMIVVVIIAVLAALSFGYYMHCKKRALAKELVTLARGCVVDIFSECVANNGEVDIEHQTFRSCRNRTFGDLGIVEIRAEGCCTNFKAEAIGSKVDYYKGECAGDYRNKLECEIAKR